MSKPDLTEILCQYAETHGLDPSADEDLYDELREMAERVISDIDDLAYEMQEAA